MNKNILQMIIVGIVSLLLGIGGAVLGFDLKGSVCKGAVSTAVEQ